MHPSKCGESFRFSYIILLHLDVLRYNLEIEFFVLQFQLLDYSVPPYSHLSRDERSYDVFSDYFNPIIQLVLFLISSDCFFHIWVVSRGMVSPGFFFVSRVGKNVVLHIYPGIEFWTVPFS